MRLDPNWARFYTNLFYTASIVYNIFICFSAALKFLALKIKNCSDTIFSWIWLEQQKKCFLFNAKYFRSNNKSNNNGDNNYFLICLLLLLLLLLLSLWNFSLKMENTKLNKRIVQIFNFATFWQELTSRPTKRPAATENLNALSIFFFI